ncbi:hypothetical protein ID866_9952, partial [Astraeus odoratus]
MSSSTEVPLVISSEMPKGKHFECMRNPFVQLDEGGSTTPLAQVGQEPASDGRTVPIQEGCIPETNQTSNVEQSSHAIGAHGERDKDKNVVKEHAPLNAHEIAYCNLGMAKEALNSVVCKNANCLQVLKAFKTVVDTGGPLSNLNLITRVAVGLLSNATRMILDQGSWDKSAFALLIKVQEVYENCTEFIAKYAESKNFIADAIVADNSLKTTPDTIQQWEKLIMPAVDVSGAVVGKVVILIDGLDEAGSEVSRKDILDILATQASFPAAFRILITSRSLPDVQKLLMDLPHTRQMSLDDVPTMNDIQLYIETELMIEHEIGRPEIKQLAWKSDGLFEWAHLACEYIKTSVAGQMGKEQFDEVISCESEEGKLLDGMYKAILESAIGKKPIVLKCFHSVMQQILSTLEPVLMHTLDAMQGAFPHKVDHYKVKVILQFMDASQSGDYFVGRETMDGNLASASLSILQSELQFNICKLDTSYMCNSEVTDLV